MAPEAARLLKLADTARADGRLRIARAYEQLARTRYDVRALPAGAPHRLVGRRPKGAR